jgi:hypothetical protein
MSTKCAARTRSQTRGPRLIRRRLLGKKNCLDEGDKWIERVCIKYMQHPGKHTCKMVMKRTDETLGTEACNVCV